METTDMFSGSKAALVRTIGWGKGNSAISGISGICKYIDAGLLHLGSSRTGRPDGYGDGVTQGIITTDDLDCGIAFASRPASLSFKYKYTNKNANDKGYAEIWVKDASGKTIASGNVNLDPASAYQTKTISLSYAAGAAKGAKIYIKFLSTNSRDFLAKNSDNISGPGIANSDGNYLGSQLYIDDITLNY